MIFGTNRGVRDGAEVIYCCSLQTSEPATQVSQAEGESVVQAGIEPRQERFPKGKFTDDLPGLRLTFPMLISLSSVLSSMNLGQTNFGC